jgi:hypothetical protein
LALDNAGFGFMNVSDYENIEQPSTIPLNNVAKKIKVSGQKAYVLIGTSNSEFTIQIIDLSDSYIKNYTEAIKSNGALRHIVFNDSIAYIDSSDNFKVYNFSDPMHPELLSTINVNASILDIKIDGNELYLNYIMTEDGRIIYSKKGFENLKNYEKNQE